MHALVEKLSRIKRILKLPFKYLIPTKMENSPGLRCTHSTLSGPESMANHLPGSRSTPPRFTTTGKNGLVPRTTFHGSKSGLKLPRIVTAKIEV